MIRKKKLAINIRMCNTYNESFRFSAASKPFVLYVVTDGDENGEIANRGFILNYQQIACPIPVING